MVAGQDSFPDAEDKILKESDERWVHRCGLTFGNSLTKAPLKVCGVSYVTHTHTNSSLFFEIQIEFLTLSLYIPKDNDFFLSRARKEKD